MCYFLIVSQQLCSKAQLYKPILPHKPVGRHCIDRFCVITEEQASSCLDEPCVCVSVLAVKYTHGDATQTESRGSRCEMVDTFLQSPVHNNSCRYGSGLISLIFKGLRQWKQKNKSSRQSFHYLKRSLGFVFFLLNTKPHIYLITHLLICRDRRTWR